MKQDIELDMKKNILLVVISMSFTVLLLPKLGMALANPSAVYCNAMGYQYENVMMPQGEVGMCILPGNKTVDAWNFLMGTEGLDSSYCAKAGYKNEQSSDPTLCKITDKCTVCTLENGTKVEVTKLMGLSFVEGSCGDGVCVLGENYLNCPKDCPSGSHDGYCDGVKDGICDPDCISQKTPSKDPDCASSTTVPNSSSTTAPSSNQPVCGNYICENGENYSNCPQDCPKATDFTIVYVIVGIVVGVLVAIIVIWSRRAQ
jgi:putative hemolysin